jgi:hypothetical protein
MKNRNVYLLATDPNNPRRDVIHSRDTELRVRVYRLEDEVFQPNPNEIQLYGCSNNKVFAFETVGITSDDALDFVEAIQWYTDYIDSPDMEIVPDDPRLGKDKDIASDIRR